MRSERSEAKQTSYVVIVIVIVVVIVIVMIRVKIMIIVTAVVNIIIYSRDRSSNSGKSSDGEAAHSKRLARPGEESTPSSQSKIRVFSDPTLGNS